MLQAQACESTGTILFAHVIRSARGRKNTCLGRGRCYNHVDARALLRLAS